VNGILRTITIIFLVSPVIIGSLDLNTPLYAQNTSSDTSPNTHDTPSSSIKVTDSIRNPDFTLINSTSGLPMYWYDSFRVCGDLFDCIVNSTDGWFGKHSFQLSTRNNTNNTWSWISSQSIIVTAYEQYKIIAHMKLNDWSTASHILIQGYNNNTEEWYQIEQCPSGTDGPLKWDVFHCEITIPTNTTAMVVTLNAGWSSQINKNAVTTFDAIHAYKVL
jgi:hypothetical protein